MSIQCFTDLGKFTPNEQKHEPGDHALVLCFSHLGVNVCKHLLAF